MRRPSRHIVAILLVMIYSLIIVSPLAPMVLKSPRMAHAVTWECSGNCEICGCSAERRASHTCCCWIKKMKHRHDNRQAEDCCKKKTRHRMTMISCNCPCGDNRLPGLAGSETSEQMPYIYIQKTIPPFENALSFSHGEYMTNLHGDPPEPPPKPRTIS